MRNKIIFFGFVSVLISAGLFSCDTSKVYDSMQDLDSNFWNEKQEIVFPVTIQDASVPYKLYYEVRYDNNYPYYNLYINRVMEDSSGKFLNKKLQGMDLFKSKTGIPLGAGMGSKKDYLILSEDNYKFPYSGKYTIRLKQYMRQENIPGISAVGFRVDKMTSEK
jgi:gliding motility-associated lipoprotein GldH